ncbi:MAG TPA: hypothetical protein VJZ00_10550 [Thermoanaerobaculia bacterium]|nr:hypothetical protein [Thermoanaerobaculia bacterium]
MGPRGHVPAFPLAGGVGRQIAAIASSGSRDTMRGAAYGFRFFTSLESE